MAASSPPPHHDPGYYFDSDVEEEARAEAEADLQANGPPSLMSPEDDPLWRDYNIVVPGLLSLGGLKAGTDAVLADLLQGAPHFTSVVRIFDVAATPGQLAAYSEADIKLLWVPLKDRFNEPVYDHIQAVVQRFMEVFAAGGHLLIHCGSGISRAATFTQAVLMTAGPYLLNRAQLRGRDPATMRDLNEAFNFLHKRRPIVSPNLDFMGRLVVVERALLGTVTLAQALEAVSPDNLKRVADEARAAYERKHPLPAVGRF